MARSRTRTARSRGDGVSSAVWGPLAEGLLTGRHRRGRQPDSFRSRFGFEHLSGERRLDAVERLVPVAREAGMPLTHMAMAFAIFHPGVTSAIAGPRTMGHLDDLLAGAETVLDDGALDRIDGIVPPRTDIGTLDMAYKPPAIGQARMRRRPTDERSAGRPFSPLEAAYTH